MSIRTFARGAAGATLALVAAPVIALHAQTPQDSAMHRTWGVPTRTPTREAAPGATGIQAVADTAFVRKARAGNLLEVRLGTLAGGKASNAAVKQFAERMVTDHTRMGNEWGALIARDRLPVKPALDAAQQQSATRLEGLSGAEFDRAYMSTMVQDHQADVATFQRMASSAQAPDVRQLAASGLVTIQQHLTMAQQVAGQLGSPPVAAAPSPAPTPGGNVVRRNTEKPTNELRSDSQYVNEVSQGHIMEVRLAEMAGRKASDSKVRQFAERMLSDFTKWRDRWTSLAADNGDANVNLGRLHKEKVDRLEKAPRGQFDRVYLDIVRENLGSMVPYFEKEGRAAHSAKVRNLVDDELPTLQQHLARAEGLGRQLHAGANAQGRRRAG